MLWHIRTSFWVVLLAGRKPFEPIYRTSLFKRSVEHPARSSRSVYSGGGGVFLGAPGGPSVGRRNGSAGGNTPFRNHIGLGVHVASSRRAISKVEAILAGI